MYNRSKPRYPNPEMPIPIYIEGFDDPIDPPTADRLFAAAYRSGLEIGDVVNFVVECHCFGQAALASENGPRIARAIRTGGAMTVNDDFQIDDDIGTRLQAWAYRAGLAVDTLIERVMDSWDCRAAA